MKEYIKVNREAYDALYVEYDNRASEKSSYEETPDTLGKPVLDHAREYFEKICVLEVGCGSGEMLEYFESQGCRTIAVELSANIANIAQRRSPQSIFILGDVQEIEFAPNQFEVIYAGALIHLFPLQDAIKLLRKFHNWLKPSGVLFVNTTIHSSSEEGYYVKEDYGVKIKRFRKKWTEEEFSRTLRECGFELICRRSTDEKNRSKYWVAFHCTPIKG